MPIDDGKESPDILLCPSAAFPLLPHDHQPDRQTFKISATNTKEFQPRMAGSLFRFLIFPAKKPVVMTTNLEV
jgi:hypothetical protein